jgi:hypothetical protein
VAGGWRGRVDRRRRWSVGGVAWCGVPCGARRGGVGEEARVPRGAGQIRWAVLCSALRAHEWRANGRRVRCRVTEEGRGAAGGCRGGVDRRRRGEAQSRQQIRGRGSTCRDGAQQQIQRWDAGIRITARQRKNNGMERGGITRRLAGRRRQQPCTGAITAWAAQRCVLWRNIGRARARGNQKGHWGAHAGGGVRAAHGKPGRR